MRKLADRVGVQPSQNGVATTITFSLSPPTPPVLFRLVRSTSPAGPVLALSGHLDLSSAAEFTDAIGAVVSDARGAHLILDLAGLALWDSFGLAALLRAQSQVGAGSVTQLILRDVPEPLLNELRATGLSERFTFADGSEAHGSEADSTEQAVAD